MDEGSRRRKRRATAANNRFAPPPPTTAPPPPPPPLPPLPPPPRHQQRPPDPLPAPVAAAPVEAAASAAVPNTPRRRNNDASNSQFSGPADQALVPTSVRVPPPSRSPNESIASSLPTSVPGGNIAMDIDNESISTYDSLATSTAGTVAHQDSDENIRRMGNDDLNAVGDGGESDCEHGGGDLFACERELADMDEPAPEDDGPPPFISGAIEGAPDGWEKPGPPPNYVPPPPRDSCPSWDEINTSEKNPGNWSSHFYQARYIAGKYKGHFSPTGATVVPPDDGGKRTVDGWDVTYGPWTSSCDAPYRNGAKKDNIIPAERKGGLDGGKLKTMGLSKERMKNNDAAFFHQLLFPFCDPSQSGIPNDSRTPYYKSVQRFSNEYALLSGKFDDYGHALVDLHDEECFGLLRCDSVVAKHWKKPDKNQRRKQANHIRSLLDD